LIVFTKINGELSTLFMIIKVDSKIISIIVKVIHVQSYRSGVAILHLWSIFDYSWPCF